MYAVIIAGGGGTRLWPLSTQKKPKQFHALVGDKPLLLESIERLSPLIAKDQVLVSTTKTLLPQCREILPEVPEKNFIVEPVGRNTGPAVGFVAAILGKYEPDAIIAALWSDHHIGRPEEFRKVLQTARDVVKEHPEVLVTIGINPTEPSTAYGYIQMNSESERIEGQRIFKVKKFVEKPDYPTAKKYVSSWQYLWNAGYLVFRADTLLREFKQHAPKIYHGLIKIQKAQGTKNEKKVIETEYAKLPNISIDYLIFEKTRQMHVIPADLDWSDIGHWASLHDILATKFGHSVIAKGHHVGHDDESSLILAHDKMIATVGLKDVIVIDTPDVILIANKNRAQDIKHLLEKLKAEGKHLYL